MPAPCVERVEFLRVELSDGRSYEHDIVVYPDGRVEPRRAKSLSKRYADLYGHTPLSREELEVYLGEAGSVDCVVVGTGTEGRMRLTREAEDLLEKLRESGVRVVIARSVELPRYCGVIRECRRPVLIVHVTC